jgi:hypothetical protein
MTIASSPKLKKNMYSLLSILLILVLISRSGAQVIENFFVEDFGNGFPPGWMTVGDVHVALLGATDNYVLESFAEATATKTLDSSDWASVVISFKYGTMGCELFDYCMVVVCGWRSLLHYSFEYRRLFRPQR